MNNMNFEEFVLQIQNLLRESDSNLDIQIQTVSKNNGIRYTGLTCRNINTVVSPVIYMEPYFRMFGDGRDLHSIVDDVLKIVRSNQFDFDAKSIYEFDLVKDRIVYVLVNKERNEDLIGSVPYRVFTEELIITYKILLDNVVDGSATIQVKNEFLEMWNVSENDLWEHANRNTSTIRKPVMNSMMEVLLRMKGLNDDEDLRRLLCGDLDLDIGMYILTNSEGINGASVIAIPFSEEMDAEYLNKMISEVNNTQVEDIEVLGDRAMIFDGNCISIA